MITCKSCQNTFEGSYCNSCGEKVINPEDRRFRKVFGELVNAFTFADSKLWKTLRSILAAPGKLSKDYLIGKRKEYMRPISLFFLANLLYFLFPIFNTFHTSLKVQMESFPYLHSHIATKLVTERVEHESLKYEDFELTYNLKTTELSKLLLILMTSMMTVVFGMVHRRYKHYMVDHFIISLELMIFTISFALQGLGLIFLILSVINPNLVNETLISTMTSLLILIHIYRLERTFYERSKQRSVINALLVLVGFIIALFFYRAVLFFITFWSI